MDKFTALFERVGEWWIGYIEEIPGVNTQGRTLEEARENLREAAQLVIEANRELARRETGGKDVIREELRTAPWSRARSRAAERALTRQKSCPGTRCPANGRQTNQLTSPHRVAAAFHPAPYASS